MRSRASLRVRLALGLVAAALSGCAARPPLRVTAADVKAPITLQNGQDLYVSLQSNRTTGYGWEWVAKPDALVTLMGEPTYAASAAPAPGVPAASGGLVGVGGSETFWFRAKAKGKQKLRFLYRRPQTDERPIDVRVLELVVQ